MSSHRVLKRAIKHRDLVKLITFTVLSSSLNKGTSLRKNGHSQNLILTGL